jgi:Spy/CpxP family protein refolding chaperone
MRGGRPDLAKTLDLTEDQKPKVAAIMKEAGEKRKALREDTSLSQEDKRAKAKALQADTTAQMKAVLTADQFAKYEKMGPGMRRNAPPAGGPGTATPPPAQN